MDNPSLFAQPSGHAQAAYDAVQHERQMSPLFTALIKFQSTMQNVRKGETAKVQSAKGSFSYTYADIAAVIEAIRLPLAEHGLCHLQLVTNIDGNPALTTVLAHESGASIEATVPLRFDNMNDPQKFGGILTYVRRYSLLGILGLATDDDDASSARTPNASYADRAHGESRSHPNATIRDAQRESPSNGSGASQRVPADEDMDWTDLWRTLKPLGVMGMAELAKIIGTIDPGETANQLYVRYKNALSSAFQQGATEPQRQVDRPLSKKQLETIRGVLPKKGLDDKGWDAFQLYTLSTNEIIRPDQLSMSEASQIIEALYALPDQPHLQAAIEASGR